MGGCVITSRFRAICTVCVCGWGWNVASVKITNLLAIWITRSLAYSPKYLRIFQVINAILFIRNTNNGANVTPPPTMLSALFIDFKVEKDPRARSLLPDAFFGATKPMMLCFDMHGFYADMKTDSHTAPDDTSGCKKFHGLSKIISNACKCNSHKTNLSKEQIYWRDAEQSFSSCIAWFFLSLLFRLAVFSCSLPPSLSVCVATNSKNFCLQNFCGYFICVNDDDYKIMVVFALNI